MKVKLCYGLSVHSEFNACAPFYLLHLYYQIVTHSAAIFQCCAFMLLCCEMSCEISGCDLHETSLLLGWSAVQQAVNSHFLSSQFHFVPAKLFFGSQKSDRTQVGYLPERLVDPAASKAKVKMNTHTHACAKPATHTHT